MIKVKVKYYKIIRGSKSPSVRYIYPYFKVEGHTYGKTEDAKTCCACVSAIMNGIVPIVSTIHDRVRYESGLFEYILTFSPLNVKNVLSGKFIEWDTQYALNTALFQLEELSKIYPQFFERFEIVELKRKED